jgi:hypothetical protein
MSLALSECPSYFPWPRVFTDKYDRRLWMMLNIFSVSGGSLKFYKLVSRCRTYRAEVGADSIRHITTHLAYIVSRLPLSNQVVNRVFVKLGMPFFYISGIGEDGRSRGVSNLFGKLDKLVISDSCNAGFLKKTIFKIGIGIFYFLEHQKRPLPVNFFAKGNNAK